MRSRIHHVPGRLRVRSAAFQCEGEAARHAQTRLEGLDGVSLVRHNPHAASLTVHYDPARLALPRLLGELEGIGCVSVPLAEGAPAARRGKALGQVILGAVVNKAIEHSAVRLVSALL